MTAGAFTPSWGAAPLPGGGARYRLWAPAHQAVALVDGAGKISVPMQRSDDGWFEIETDAIPVNGGYAFKIDGRLIPDPAARAQMGDVHGPSRLVDSSTFTWRDDLWLGRPWEEAVIYELHTGTFSPEGTFEGISRKLDHLASLGVTAIELMPVAQFGGTRGWGYDGVLLYAPHVAYGGPENLKRLVDASHHRGLMVLLDVVYNHFGPDGNYLHLYAPDFFHPERQTPWGAAIAYEKQPVRRFFIENALYWLHDYRMDGLRLDAIDQIHDPAPTHILEELAAEVRSMMPDRHLHLTTEDERNIVKLHERDGAGKARLYTGEWNDDFHHTAHVLATGERDGYYLDYATDVSDLARCLAEGYVYQGETSPSKEEPRGVPCASLPPSAFIDFLQNHDQVGNRAFGERLTSLADDETVDLLTAILLLSPHTPLLFMGEEWGERRPFFYFTDFNGELAAAVRDGRRAEFEKWPQFADPGNRLKIPDPNAVQTADASRLDWTYQDTPAGAARMGLVRKLLDIRKRELVPRLDKIRGGQSSYETFSPSAFAITWRLPDDGVMRMVANFGEGPQAHAVGPDFEHVYASSDEAVRCLRSGHLPGRAAVVGFEGGREHG
jgi:malto-oligosyltrehalose trehalohydrolase